MSTIFDLRTTAEAEKKPDVEIPPGAEYTRVNIIGDSPPKQRPSSLAGVDQDRRGRRLLTDANITFVTAEDQRAQFATLLEQIAEADGPVVIHCTSGKDRTGWASALLLHIAGVSDEDIMANYLLTNEYAADYIDATAAAMAETRGTEFGEAIRVVLSVEADYLQAGISTAIEQYGSLDLYLTEGLGLEKETLTDLRNKLTTA